MISRCVIYELHNAGVWCPTMNKKVHCKAPNTVVSGGNGLWVCRESFLAKICEHKQNRVTGGLRLRSDLFYPIWLSIDHRPAFPVEHWFEVFGTLQSTNKATLFCVRKGTLIPPQGCKLVNARIWIMMKAEKFQVHMEDEIYKYLDVLMQQQQHGFTKRKMLDLCFNTP